MVPTNRKDPFFAEFEKPLAMLRRNFGDLLPEWPSENVAGSYPVDIHEDENFIYVDAELPGFNKDDVNVTLENGVLSIAAERTDEQGDDKHKHLKERRFTQVQRAFKIPGTVDEGKVDATLSDGVLKLKLHKRDEVKPRRIEVK